MNFIVKYFWALGVVIAAINSFLIKNKFSKTDLEEEIQEQKKVVLGYFLILSIPCFLLQLFQILGNYHNPLYIFYRDFSNIFYWCGVGSIILIYVSVLFAVIKFKNIEKYSPILFRANLKRSFLIFIILGIMIFAMLIIFVFSSHMEIKETLESFALK